jgi:hypothetical protein
MTSKSITDWNSTQYLDVLLDAGAAELLSASEEEVRECLVGTGAKGRKAIEAVRRLVSAAENGSSAASDSILIAPGAGLSRPRAVGRDVRSRS